MPFRKFCGVAVHLHYLAHRQKLLPVEAGLLQAEPGAKREEQVGLLKKDICISLTPCIRPSEVEWMVRGKSIGGMMAKTPDMPAEMPPAWGVYFAVADTDATVAKAQELGASVFMGPADIEPGRFAVLADNVGAVFNVLQLKS